MLQCMELHVSALVCFSFSPSLFAVAPLFPPHCRAPVHTQPTGPAGINRKSRSRITILGSSWRGQPGRGCRSYGTAAHTVHISDFTLARFPIWVSDTCTVSVCPRVHITHFTPYGTHGQSDTRTSTRGRSSLLPCLGAVAFTVTTTALDRVSGVPLCQVVCGGLWRRTCVPGFGRLSGLVARFGLRRLCVCAFVQAAGSGTRDGCEGWL